LEKIKSGDEKEKPEPQFFFISSSNLVTPILLPPRFVL